MNDFISTGNTLKSSFQFPLYGLVFAGGKSLRMGHDKGLIPYHGKPQREFLFELLSTVCDTVFTSCKQTEDVPATLNPLPDYYPLESPLNGLLTCFHHHANVAWLTVPVDMPYVDFTTIEFLLKNRDVKKLATCFYDSEGIEPEPLLTLWEPASKPYLITYYEKGNKGIKTFLLQHEVNLLRAPDKRIHHNVNSEEELNSFYSSFIKS